MLVVLSLICAVSLPRFPSESHFFLNSSILLHNLDSSLHVCQWFLSLPYVYQGISIQKALFKQNCHRNGIWLACKLVFLMSAMPVHMGSWCLVSSHPILQ